MRDNRDPEAVGLFLQHQGMREKQPFTKVYDEATEEGIDIEQTGNLYRQEIPTSAVSNGGNPSPR